MKWSRQGLSCAGGLLGIIVNTVKCKSSVKTILIDKNDQYSTDTPWLQKKYFMKNATEK